MAARIEVRPSVDGQFYWALVGGNNQDMCVSETFTRKADAKRAACRALWLMGGPNIKVIEP